MKRVKVLHILEATLGGTGRHVCDLLRCFENDREFSLTLAYSGLRADTRFEAELCRLSRGSASLIEIPMAREVAPVRDGLALWKLCRLIRREQFDIVHAHSSKAGALGRLAARLSGRDVVTVYTPHSIAIRLGRGYWLIEKLLGYLADRVIAVSPSERAELSLYQIVHDSKVRTISLGIDVEAFRGGRCRGLCLAGMGISDSTLVVGCVGRLCDQKDPMTFVRAAEIVVREFPGVRFVWVGDGELRDAVAREVREKNLTSVVSLLPFDAEIAPLMRSLDVFLLVSRYESFGYVTCEAMAAGIPIVATNVAGSNDLVAEGVSGFLVRPGDPEATAKALATLLRDKQLRDKMGQSARRRVEDYFGVDAMASGIREMYLEALQEKRTFGWTSHQKGLPGAQF